MRFKNNMFKSMLNYIRNNIQQNIQINELTHYLLV